MRRNNKSFQRPQMHTWIINLMFYSAKFRNQTFLGACMQAGKLKPQTRINCESVSLKWQIAFAFAKTTTKTKTIALSAIEILSICFSPFDTFSHTWSHSFIKISQSINGMDRKKFNRTRHAFHKCVRSSMYDSRIKDNTVNDNQEHHIFC